jgi:hypothetical protein
MKITIGRRSWRGGAIAALLLIGVVAVPAAPAQATFHAKNGRIAFGPAHPLGAPDVGIPCDQLVFTRC